jgi:hypothetical protein
MNETQNPALNNSIDQMSGADEQLWMAAGRAELSFRCDTSAPNVEHGPGRAEESVSLWPPIERIETGHVLLPQRQVIEWRIERVLPIHLLGLPRPPHRARRQYVIRLRIKRSS